MLRSTLRSCTQLFLIAVIIFPTITQANRTKDEPVDLSILAQSDALIPYMTASQKIKHLQLEDAIESAESDLKSGQFMASAKASSLDPNRDYSARNKRGEQLIEQAQATIETLQIDLVELLKSVEAQQGKQATTDLARFDYTLESANYDTAVETLTKQLLETCWELGYETLFFDGIFIQDSQGTRRANAQLRNDFYDTLIKIDGNKFSVTIPVDFKLKTDSQGTGSDLFSYENAATFAGDKKALLSLELIQPDNSNTGLLSLRAIDLKTQLIAAYELIKISDLSDKLALETAELKDNTLDKLVLHDEANTLEILSNLSTPYQFELKADSSTTEVAELLTLTLLQNTDLQLTNSDFILRAYGETLDTPNAWSGQANAQLRIAENEDADSYQLSAKADGNDRLLPAGKLTLSQVAE